MTHPEPIAAPLKRSIWDRAAKQAVVGRLAKLRTGQVTLCDSDGQVDFGSSAAFNDLHCTVQVHDQRFYREATVGGPLSAAESYLRRDWDCSDLTNLFRIFLQNGDATNQLRWGVVNVVSLCHRWFHWLRSNTRAGSRRNIAAHYDLGNDFYKLWLDDTMAYSSGVFPRHKSSMHEASVNKFDRICEKLALKPEDEVLEIGTGWGGFAIHAAEKYGCDVTTTTISKEQFNLANQRVRQAGLNHRVKLLDKDYRDLKGQFDKVVSIEMIESVGHRYLDQFFRQCSSLLRPDGALVLQAIVMPEGRYKQYLRSVDFIQRYIFPGGCLPSLAAILESVGRTSDLRFVQAEDFAPHYAETLRRWRHAFHLRLDDVRRLGYTEEFIRLWDYYLCYCEAAFEERYIGLLQIQFDKSQRRRKLDACMACEYAEREEQLAVSR